MIWSICRPILVQMWLILWPWHAGKRQNRSSWLEGNKKWPSQQSAKASNCCFNRIKMTFSATSTKRVTNMSLLQAQQRVKTQIPLLINNEVKFPQLLWSLKEGIAFCWACPANQSRHLFGIETVLTAIKHYKFILSYYISALLYNHL